LVSALVIAPFLVLSVALPVIGAGALALAVAIVAMPGVRDVASLSPGGTDGVLLLVAAGIAIAATGWLCLRGLRALRPLRDEQARSAGASDAVAILTRLMLDKRDGCSPRGPGRTPTGEAQ
jgi:hypothetical protein